MMENDRLISTDVVVLDLIVGLLAALFSCPNLLLQTFSAFRLSDERERES